MDHSLVNTLVFCVVGALVFGLIAKQLKLPALLGYLLAGIAVGPYTPGFTADIGIAQQLAEIGIMLLMFGVGMHFSLTDLLNVRRVALPGAIFQMLTGTVLGALFIHWLGAPWLDAFMFGFSLSVASTVVLLRALEQRDMVNSEPGKIAVGWLIVEDIAMVLAIVILPVIASLVTSAHDTGIDSMIIIKEVALVIAKIGLFAVFMLVLGRRLLPPVLGFVAHTRSHELAALTTLAIAIGFAYVAYAVFDASFALGAFFAGLVLNESKIGHRFAESSLPMRDIFSVLFFVSVGMLFNPLTLINFPVEIVATVAVIVVGKGAAALAIMALFRQNKRNSAIIAASLAQIGEFSFIFAGMAVSHNVMAAELQDLIIAGALISIAINHFIFKAIDRMVEPKPVVETAH